MIGETLQVELMNTGAMLDWQKEMQAYTEKPLPFTPAQVRFAGYQPTQEELEEVRDKALTLQMRHPDLGYREHTAESYEETRKLMELSLLDEAMRGKKMMCYNTVRWAWRSVKAYVKKELTWKELTSDEIDLARTAYVFPALGRKQGILKPEGLNPAILCKLSYDSSVSEVCNSFLNYGVAPEWVSALRAMFEAFHSNSEFATKVVNCVKPYRMARSTALMNARSMVGFIELVVNRSLHWSTSVALEFGKIARFALVDSLLANGLATEDQVCDREYTAELARVAAETPRGSVKGGLVSETAFQQISNSANSVEFLGSTDLFDDYYESNLAEQMERDREYQEQLARERQYSQQDYYSSDYSESTTTWQDVESLEIQPTAAEIVEKLRDDLVKVWRRFALKLALKPEFRPKTTKPSTMSLYGYRVQS